MRKVLLLVCLAAVIVPMAFNIYSQSPQKPSASALSTDLGAYRLTPLQPARENLGLQPQKETLNYINAESETYQYTPINKMGTGVINTATSWVDVPAKIMEETEKSNFLVGVTLGFGEGIISGLIRGAAGITDVATFGLPPYDKPLMEPAQKVENPNEGFKIDLLKW